MTPHRTNALEKYRGRHGEQMCGYCSVNLPEGRLYWCSDRCAKMVYAENREWQRLLHYGHNNPRCLCANCNTRRDSKNQKMLSEFNEDVHTPPVSPGISLMPMSNPG